MKDLTRKDLEREARKHGGWIESDTFGTNVRLQCLLPVGFTWTCDDGLHALVCTWHKGDHAWKQDAIQDALERMSWGKEPCDCSECKHQSAEAVEVLR